MMFNNNNGGRRYNNNGGNNNSNFSVNTQIHPFYSDISSLIVNCWNDKFSLRFSPAIGKDANGITVYDKDHKISTSLTHVKAEALLLKFKKKILPMILGKEEEGPVKPFGVPIQSPTNGSCQLMIEHRKEEDGSFSSYLIFAKNIVDGHISPENIVQYKFNKIEVFDEIDIESGEKKVTYENAELLFFMSIIKEQILATGLNDHARRMTDAYRKRAEAFANGGNNNQQAPNPQMNDFNPAEEYAMFE